MSGAGKKEGSEIQKKIEKYFFLFFSRVRVGKRSSGEGKYDYWHNNNSGGGGKAGSNSSRPLLYFPLFFSFFSHAPISPPFCTHTYNSYGGGKKDKKVVEILGGSFFSITSFSSFFFSWICGSEGTLGCKWEGPSLPSPPLCPARCLPR